MMEILRAFESGTPVRVLVLDFDGTLSTLRSGWEEVMAKMMVDYLGKEEEAEIARYIEQSAGIQTIHQMKWLRDKVLEKNGIARDAWDYKDEYNDRLMEDVRQKTQKLESGQADREQYLIAGAIPFLKLMRTKGLKLHIASGTDQVDVRREAALLGIAPLVDSVSGAPYRQEDCSKEKVLKDLIARQGFHGPEVCVIGDGRVEIALGVEMGARTLGLATNEQKGRGINPVKVNRLTEAGAEALAGDFLDIDALLAWMNLEG